LTLAVGLCVSASGWRVASGRVNGAMEAYCGIVCKSDAPGVLALWTRPLDVATDLDKNLKMSAGGQPDWKLGRTAMLAYDAPEFSAGEGVSQTSLGLWSLDEIESPKAGDLLAKKAPGLAPEQKAQALWLLAARDDALSWWGEPFVTGLVAWAFLGVAAVVAMGLWQAGLAIKKKAGGVAQKAREIAEEGRAVTLAHEEREALAREAAAAASEKGHRAGPGEPEGARGARRL
jgi:hypothetical protein